MPSSIDVPFGVTEYDMDEPLGFRRQPFWFLTFLMTPFKDVEPRTVEDTRPTRIKQRRDRY